MDDFHKVSVDNEVYMYVREHATPDRKDFNSAIRQILFKKKKHKLRKRNSKKIGTSKQKMTIPILHNDIPASLRHILEVTNLVRRKAYDRVDATNFVAKRHSICRTTVADKYTRQLGLSTNDFDRLLEDPDFQKLKKILREKFYDFRDIIDQVL